MKYITLLSHPNANNEEKFLYTIFLTDKRQIRRFKKSGFETREVPKHLIKGNKGNCHVASLAFMKYINDYIQGSNEDERKILEYKKENSLLVYGMMNKNGLHSWVEIEDSCYDGSKYARAIMGESVAIVSKEKYYQTMRISETKKFSWQELSQFPHHIDRALKGGKGQIPFEEWIRDIKKELLTKEIN